jgi:hypothetical protein
LWQIDQARINDQLQFGADIVLSRGAANRLDLASGDSLALDTILLDQTNRDISLSRGAANRLDLATGDKFYAQNINEVRFANHFAGADAGAKISAAITDLPATGGTVDARGLEGAAQVISSGLTLGSATKPVTLLLGAATYELQAGITVPRASRIIGLGRDATKLQINYAGSGITLGGALVYLTGFELNRKSGFAGVIPASISGDGAHQLVIDRIIVGGANTADIDLDNFFNTEVRNCIFTARAAQSGIAIRTRGTGAASTTLRVYSNEFNNYNRAVELTNTFGTDIWGNIGVGNNRLVYYLGGIEGHVAGGNWAESSGVASTFAYELAEVAGNKPTVVHYGTRLSGTPVTGLVTFSGAATQREFLDQSVSGQARARVYNSANQSISNVTWTALTFDSESFDTGALHSTASNTSRLTVPWAGKWRFWVQVQWDAAAGSRGLRILKNGATVEALAEYVAAPATTFSPPMLMVTLDLAASDYCEALVFQDSGAAVNVLAGRASTYFAAEYMGI